MRKHLFLAAYVEPAAMKLKQFGKTLALVDGFAGANAYGQERVGSTLIMVEAAKKVIAQGAYVVIHACEPNRSIRTLLESNLAGAISDGLLYVHACRHAEAISEIQLAIRGMPALVFLDPQACTEMTIERDIKPWAERQRTDVLGVFMAGQACRTSAGVLRGDEHSIHPREYIGQGWESVATEDAAYDQFFEEIRNLKKFVGMYRLRKVVKEQDAYGLFGLSGHPDGYWLLSRAIAKDMKLRQELKDSLAGYCQDSLFGDDFNVTEISELVELARPIAQEYGLTGAKLASKMFELGIGIQECFGKYEESDFTDAAYAVTGKTRRKAKSATHAKG